MDKNENLINLEKQEPEINNVLIIKDLISSLKEKVTIYENQIKKLIDDKVKLQMDMNSMILQNLSLKKNNENENLLNNNDANNINNGILQSLIDINQKLLSQNKELKSQLDIYKSNLDKCINKDTKCKFCEEKKLELIKMASEKEEIYNSIKFLRKQLDELKLNEKIKKEKKKKQKIEKYESLPSIEQYFIVNNKFQLVDNNKELWHMKKCMKFQEFKNKYKEANLSPDDLLKEFVENYEIKIDEEDNEDMDELNSSEVDKEEADIDKKKYLPPLPGMNNNYSKKKGNNKNINNNSNNDINNIENNINIIDNNEDKEKENNNNNIEINLKEVINSEKNIENNNINNVNNNNNNNEIKEETSFNLSDNTD